MRLKLLAPSLHLGHRSDVVAGPEVFDVPKCSVEEGIAYVRHDEFRTVLVLAIRPVWRTMCRRGRFVLLAAS